MSVLSLSKYSISQPSSSSIAGHNEALNLPIKSSISLPPISAILHDVQQVQSQHEYHNFTRSSPTAIPPTRSIVFNKLDLHQRIPVLLPSDINTYSVSYITDPQRLQLLNNYSKSEEQNTVNLSGSSIPFEQSLVVSPPTKSNSVISSQPLSPQSMESNSNNTSPIQEADSTISQTAELAHETKNTRKYKCKTCEKFFTTSGHLARHSRIHTGERKHVCPFPSCDARFARHDNCMQHYRTHKNPKNRKRRVSKK